MKHISNRDYTDLVLNKHLDKGAILEEEYEKANVELTKERIEYLVVVRGLYTAAINESEVKGIEGVDEIPEGEKVLDGLVITPDEKTNKEVTTEEDSNNNEEQIEEETAEEDPGAEEVEKEEDNPKEDESKTDEQLEKEEVTTEEDNLNTKNNKKGNKNTQKNK